LRDDWRGWPPDATLTGAGGGQNAPRVDRPEQMPVQTVLREIVLAEGASGCNPVPVLWLSWHAADPLAVVLVVGASPPHPSLLQGRWVMLRDAVRAAVSGNAGCGAPGGSPAPHRSGHVHLAADAERVTLTLQSVTGMPLVLSVGVGPLRAFLAETDAAVPPGSECCRSALDAEIERMLRRS
jgi:Streptomyces sporulation and cell division protein, SsgA